MFINFYLLLTEMKHYLFGYGSLINTASRLRTADTDAIPARVVGWQRAWNFYNPERKRNALGVFAKENAQCNGVILEVTEESLAKFDQREKRYQRVEVDPNKVITEEKLEGKVWIYVPEDPKIPTKESPIHQSYVDVVIMGCLEFGEGFAQECIKNTLFWNHHWLNDRENPSYPQTLRNLPTEKIDQILKKTIPEEFKKRN